MAVRAGMLRLEHQNSTRTSRFERAGVDSWRGLDAYFAGESLTVRRDPAGVPTRIELATYVLTRSPGDD